LHNLDLDKSHNGLLHFAEHLIFVETKNFNQNKLRTKRNILFNVLDAYASANFLVITVICSRTDFIEVCQILKEMLYSWKCNKKQFLEEQQAIIEEIQDFISQPINKTIKTLGKQVFDSNINVLGSIQKIKSLTFLQLKEIKKVWKKMIDTAPRSLLIAGPKFTTTENKILADLLDIKNYSKPIKLQPPIPIVTHYISLPAVEAIVVDTVNSSPFFILLQRIYYVRHLKLNPNWEFFFTRETNHLVYAVYKNSKANLDKKQSKEFLFNKPTKKEFISVQNIVTKHIDSLSDGTDPQEILGWLDTFHLRNIPEFQGKTFFQIRKIYSTVSYDDFLTQWKKIFKDVKV